MTCSNDGRESVPSFVKAMGLAAISLIAQWASVHADIGPKPTIHVAFATSDGSPVKVASGTLLVCNQSDCSDAKPLGVLGPQHFWCSGDSCGALAYGFPSYLMLEIVFPDGKKLKSNIFSKRAFDAKYAATVLDSRIEVHEL